MQLNGLGLNELLGTDHGEDDMHCTPLEKPKAHKQHRCTSCGEVIAAGETYYRWRSYIDGDAGTNKMHPECYEMHDADGGEWDYSMYNYERPQAVPNA